MSSKETAIRIPKSIGTNNLIETFGKFNLSSDVKDFLSGISGKIVVTYSPGAEKPELEILDRYGKTICSIEEFTKLGGFRRWVNDELKQLEKEQASEEKIKLLCLFVRKAEADGTALGARIDESNEARFRQFNAMVGIIKENLEKIMSTVDNGWRTYLKNKGNLLVRICYKLMLACLDQTRLGKEALEEALFENGVPKWLYGKFTDKSFTANLRNDSVTLLFPRGNYTKSISLTLREIQEENFLASNQAILVTSGSIVALARHDYDGILPDVPEAHEEEMENFLLHHAWVLNNPYTAEEILELRIAGKGIPTFKARQKPNPSGKNARPENEVQRLKREFHNVLMELNVAWLHMQNFVIPCENPRENFWDSLKEADDQWDIKPTHNLYQNLKDFGTDLGPIRDLSSKSLLVLMGGIACTAIRIPQQCANGLALAKTITQMLDHSGYENRGGKAIGGIDERLNVDVAVMEQTIIDEATVATTKALLGATTPKKDTRVKRSGASSVRLSTEVLDELSIINNHPLYEKVKNWLGTSFKTKNRAVLQLIAAERIAGEVLKYQGQILGEDFDEYNYLDELERIDEDED